MRRQKSPVVGSWWTRMWVHWFRRVAPGRFVDHVYSKSFGIPARDLTWVPDPHHVVECENPAGCLCYCEGCNTCAKPLTAPPLLGC